MTDWKIEKGTQLRSGVGTRLYSHGAELEKTARAYEPARRLDMNLLAGDQ